MMMSIQQQAQAQQAPAQPQGKHLIAHEELKRTASSSATDELPLKKRKLDIASQDADIFNIEIYKSYIKSALDLLDKQKDHMLIDKLTSQIMLPQSNAESLSVNNLSIILRTLSQEISRIDNKHCQSLILSLINLKITDHRDNGAFVRNYQLFVTVLVSGIPKWWNEVCHVIVSEFVRDEIEFYHEILQRVLTIIPSSINILQKNLRQSYPNKNNRKSELVNYVKNLLRVNEYCHDLNFANWSLIIENCIKLDVELQNELDELDEEEADIDEEDDEDDEEEEDEDSDEEEDKNITEDEDGEDIGEDEHHMIKTISNLSTKLDSIMVVLLSKTTVTPADLDSGEGVELYNILSSLFKTHILPTHFTRCIQYLMFNLATRHEQLMDSFLYLLIEISFQQQEVLQNRVKSMQYISSFVARTQNLPKDKLLFVTSFLISWMDRFIKEREVEVEDATNLQDRFKLFYHCFQTLIYIFCFKYKQFKKNNNEWECGIDRFFQKAIITSFNPLKYCNENVVKIFAELSAAENLCYCFSILEKIKRENYGLNYNQLNTNELNGYFPFDPLMLRQSKKMVQDFYVDWRSEEEEDDNEL